MNKPNLFSYATSELSQDAFFCWLFEWAIEDYVKENECLQKASKDFLMQILPNRIDNYAINKVKIDKQVPVIVLGQDSRNRIDFTVEINDEILLVFEDKTKSTTSDSQLKPYRDYMSKIYSKFKGGIYYFYLKSDIVWENEKRLVERNGYTVVDLFRISEIMSQNIGHAIYDDYCEYVRNRISKLNSYRLIKPSEWDVKNWQGFLVDFVAKWGKGSVNNFYLGGSYWYWLSSHSNCFDIGCYVSLEFVDKKLAIKTVAENGKPRLNQSINDMARKKVKETFFGYKGAFGNRNALNTTTIFEFQDYFVINDNGLIDFDKSYLAIMEIKKKFDEMVF